MSKHTSGPWVVHPPGTISHPNTAAVSPLGAFDWVCSMQLSNCPNWRADAALIAAAPDLLEACKKMLAEIDDAPEKFPSTVCSVADEEMRAAVAKAEGNL